MQKDLFEDIAVKPDKTERKQVQGTTHHLWTQDKSALIAEYLHRFLLVTKHGIYLDLFAGPQAEKYCDDWSLKRVLERRQTGPQFSRYVVCEQDKSQIALLNQLRDKNPNADIRIHPGDCNELVHDMLKDAQIGPRSATFALLDQRTFECHWETVSSIANYKEGYKVEQFYFLAESWIARAYGGTKHKEKLTCWWGGQDYERFFDVRPIDRANLMAKRFVDELGYKWADPWSIHDKQQRGRTMYFMIHASDHPRAQSLMAEAYNAIHGGSVPPMEQPELFSKPLE